jgi:serine/threonine protein kinase
LSSGDKLGPYEVEVPLGAGGMGEVCKARDTRLDRSVAVKVLPDHIAQRDDARARFEREARAVASLNHAGICTLYDIGPNYMVMELIDGETLAGRMEKGPVPLEQALTWAIQIAGAMDRAHRAGVTHRGIKPQHIMLTRDGVKVLDFSLAKPAANSSGPSEATLTKAPTTEGTVLGTPQYMEPEQFEGKEADARSDIWAFGAVLCEMVAGQKAFRGKNYTSLVAAILGGEPAPMAVKPFTPAWLERLVKRCLEREADDRYQSMRDLVIDLKSPPAEVASTAASSSRWPWAVAAAAAVFTLAAAGVAPICTDSAAAALPVEFDIPATGRAQSIAISPDGKMMVWRNQGAGAFSIRSLNSAKVRTPPMEGLPFSWSPGGKSIAFRTGQVPQTMDAAGSTAQTVWSGVAIAGIT